MIHSESPTNLMLNHVKQTLIVCVIHSTWPSIDKFCATLISKKVW